MDYIKKFMEDNELEVCKLYIIDGIKYPFSFIDNGYGKIDFWVDNVPPNTKMEMLIGILNGTFKIIKINKKYQQIIENVLNLKLGDKIAVMKDWEILKKNLKGGDKQGPCLFLVKSDGLYYQDDSGKMVNSHDVLGKIITGEYTYKLV